jgi:hypothetical protein
MFSHFLLYLDILSCLSVCLSVSLLSFFSFSYFFFLLLSDASPEMMIIQDEHPLKAESTMIGDKNSIIDDDEINDLSIGNGRISSLKERLPSHDDLFKSPNKRKQIKPNRYVQRILLFILMNARSSSLTNDHDRTPNGTFRVQLFLLLPSVVFYRD